MCKGIADAKRLQIMDAIRDGEMSVGELCDELDLPQANVSQHLAILRNRGLVVARRDGQRVFYSMASPKIIQAMDLMSSVLADHLNLTTDEHVGSVV